MSNAAENIMLEGFSLCEGVVQRYIAALQCVDERTMWPDGTTATNEIVIKRREEDTDGVAIRLDVVPRTHMFDLQRFPNKAVQQAMVKIIGHLVPVAQNIIERVLEPDSGVALPRRELLEGSRIIADPSNTTFLAYNTAHGVHIRDNVAVRIGFVWGADSRFPDAQSENQSS